MVDYVVVFQDSVQIAGHRPSPGQEAPAKIVIDRDQKDFHGILPGTIAN